jgi:hypothetical protein
MDNRIQAELVRRCTAGAVALASCFGAHAGTAEPQAAPATVRAKPAAAVKPVAVVDGLEILSVSLTAESFLVDVRYRASDVEKAQAILDRSVHPSLINESTGERYGVPSAPKVGTLRQTTRGKKQVLRPGTTYFMLFANAGRKLKAGDRVTLDAGEFKVEHLVLK